MTKSEVNAFYCSVTRCCFSQVTARFVLTCMKIRSEAPRGRITWGMLSAEECFGVFLSLQESHTEEQEGEEQVHEQPQQQEEY